jgi:hypothetical protein
VALLSRRVVRKCTVLNVKRNIERGQGLTKKPIHASEGFCNESMIEQDMPPIVRVVAQPCLVRHAQMFSQILQMIIMVVTTFYEDRRRGNFPLAHTTPSQGEHVELSHPSTKLDAYHILSPLAIHVLDVRRVLGV